MGAEVLGGATFVDTLPVAGWPDGSVRVVEPAEAPVTCWTWTPDRPEGGVWSAATCQWPRASHRSR